MAPLSANVILSTVIKLSLPTIPAVFPRAPDGGSCTTASSTASPGESQTGDSTLTSNTSSTTPTAGATPALLSYGAIAGIVVGVVAGIGLAAVGLYVFLTQTRWAKKRHAAQLRERERKRFLRPRRKKTINVPRERKVSNKQRDNTNDGTASERQPRNNISSASVRPLQLSRRVHDVGAGNGGGGGGGGTSVGVSSRTRRDRTTSSRRQSRRASRNRPGR